MALSKERLANKIAEAMNVARQETRDYNAARDQFANDLAEAIVDEIKMANAVGVDSRGDTHNLTIQ